MRRWGVEVYPPRMAAPGASRFNMKGNAYLGLQDYVNRFVPGGTPALLGQLSPAVREFYSQPFTAAGWYDVLPIDELTRACATLSDLPHDELCRRFGDNTLERDKSGVYRALLRFATPDLLVRALPYTTKRYFDFVRLDVANLDARNYRVTVTGVPRAIAWTYIHVTTIFIVRAIEGAGAKNVVAKTGIPRPIAVVHGEATVEFERDLRWDIA